MGHVQRRSKVLSHIGLDDNLDDYNDNEEGISRLEEELYPELSYLLDDTLTSYIDHIETGVDANAGMKIIYFIYGFYLFPFF